MEKKLNNKQKLFVDEMFINGFNQTRAYMSVYQITNERLAQASSSRLLSNDIVKCYYQHKFKEYRETLDINKEKMLDQLVDELNLFSEIKYLAKKTTLTTDEAERYRRLTMVLKASDINKSRDMINKLQGNYEPEKVEVKHNIWKIGFAEDKPDETIENTEDE